MINFTRCHQQIHSITEMSNVFLYLIERRELCDSDCARRLFFEYLAAVRNHMEEVDTSFCGRLIQSQDRNLTNVADRFLSGSMEIKRIFARYRKDWCDERKRELKIADHAAFVRDTNQMFELVLERIQRETESLYPLMRELDERGGRANAA